MKTARRVVQHSRTRTTERALTVAKTSVPYLLCRVHLDGHEEPVSEHPDFGSGWSAGTHTVTVIDKQGAYSEICSKVVDRRFLEECGVRSLPGQ